MVARTTTTRKLEPGSTGWVAADLHDPEIRRQWDENRVELVHGVIAKMPPAYFNHSHVVDRLFDVLKAYFRSRDMNPSFATDVDFIIEEAVVYRADGVMLLPEDIERQREAQRRAGQRTDVILSILTPPTLVIESVSIGHEKQDRLVKKNDYAGAGAPHYWILSYFDRSLHCYRLEGGSYVLDASGTRPEVIQPAGFPGLSIPTQELFPDL